MEAAQPENDGIGYFRFHRTSHPMKNSASSSLPCRAITGVLRNYRFDAQYIVEQRSGIGVGIIINKKKVVIIAAIVLIAAIGVSLLAVSCTADTGNGISPANATVNDGELEGYADEPELTAVEEMTPPDSMTETDDLPDEEQAESSTSSETQPSATSQNAARSSGAGEKASASTGNSGNSVSIPSKRWVEDTQQVWVEDRAA